MSNKIRPGRWLYVLSAVIFVVGISLFIYLLISGISSMNTGRNRVAVPGKHTIEFETAGKKHVFYEFNSVYNGKMYSTSEEIDGLFCSLINKKTGKEIDLKTTLGNYTYSIGSSSGRSVFEFVIDEPGDYEFKAWYENEGPTVIFAIGENYVGKIFFMIFSCISILMISIFTSLIILIITIVKRNKSRKALMKNA